MTENNGKFIMSMIGPGQAYRLDNLVETLPSELLNRYLIVITNRFSYNLFTKYHNKINFVIYEDIFEKYGITSPNERFVEIADQAEYNKKLREFYNVEKGLLFPYDMHRYIFLYLLENNITKFVILDSDTVISSDLNTIETYFKKLPEKVFFNYPFGVALSDTLKTRVSFFETYIKPKYPELNYNRDDIVSADGWVRGFCFANKEDMRLFYNVWELCIQTIFSDPQKFRGEFFVDISEVIFSGEWISTTIMQLFKDRGYSYTHHADFVHPITNSLHAYMHCTRPEEKLYRAESAYADPNWYFGFKFDYSNVRYIHEFVKKNRDELVRYYNSWGLESFATDTHVFCKLKIK